MNLLRKFLRNQRGAAAIEFGLALPVALVLILGCMNFGIYLYFTNSMSAAIDETARSAILWPTPNDAELQANFEDSLLTAKSFGSANLTVTHGTSLDGRAYVDLEGTGAYDINLIFVDLGSIPVQSTRRAYLQA